MVRTKCFMTLAALAVVSQFAPVLAQDILKNDPSKQEKPAASLKVGDLAPALKVTKWLQGEAVRKFEPGKVYVVEFWATWCGAPICYMPHLAQLQARYKDQGVTIISFTSRGILGRPGNSEEEVTAFVKKRGPTLKYTFAYADHRTTADAWLKAAGREHFTTFVVDKAGRIAYMGGPMFLGMVLAKVVAGGASAKVIGAEMAKVVAEYQTVCSTLDRDPKAFTQAFEKFETKYPALADFLPAVSAKLGLLLKDGDPRVAKRYAETLVEKAIKQKNVFVLEVTYRTLRDRKESIELVAVAVRAAEALVRIDGGKGAQSLLLLADAYFVNGDKARAKEYANRAIDAASGDSSHFQQEIEKEARRLAAEK